MDMAKAECKTEATSEAVPFAPGARSSRARTKTPVLPILALVLCLAITIVNVLLVFRTIYINRSDQFPGRLRTLYATGITIAATILTSFVTDQLRSNWLVYIDRQLQVNGGRVPVERLDKLWRATLDLAGAKERLTTTRSWPIQLSYLVTALITASIVASTTPTLTTKSMPFSPLLPRGDDYACAKFLAPSQAPGRAEYL